MKSLRDEILLCRVVCRAGGLLPPGRTKSPFRAHFVSWNDEGIMKYSLHENETRECKNHPSLIKFFISHFCGIVRGEKKPFMNKI